MHSIHGFLANPEMLNQFSIEHRLSHPCTLLEQKVGFLPLSDADLDRLNLPTPNFVAGFTYLSEQLMELMAKWSKKGTIAYIEADYFGGTGEQGAVAYTNGGLSYSPKLIASGQINDVLHLLDVIVPVGVLDGFDAVGLGKRRTNEVYLID